MNMKKWCDELIAAKEKPAIPILSFPSVSLLGIGVGQLISDAELQAKGMKAVADRNRAGAAVSMMDLSVEAEAFGSTIRVSDGEVPTVIGSIVDGEDGANALEIPQIGTARTKLYLEAIQKAKQLITDRPVFAGMIGPFSLAGRLMDVNEALVDCYDEPELLHTVLRKTTEFLTNYAQAYRQIGADGIVMAEPLAGLLPPALAEEFSSRYIKTIVESVQSDDFAFIYHNCGNGTILQIDSILEIGAFGYHFGNSIRMSEMLPHIPKNVLVMGNVDPASVLRNGTTEYVKTTTKEIMAECCGYPNFVISSGCDIPPMTPWENIDAFFEAVNEFYAEQK